MSRNPVPLLPLHSQSGPVYALDSEIVNNCEVIKNMNISDGQRLVFYTICFPDGTFMCAPDYCKAVEYANWYVQW